MKKLLLLATVLSVGAVAVNAQNYKNSIGLNVGTMEGLSYKGFLNQNVALVLDLGINFIKTPGLVVDIDKYDGVKEKSLTKGWTYGIWEFEFNPNIVFQKEIKSWDKVGLSWFAGAGASIGMMKPTSASYNGWSFNLSYDKVFGKWGINAIGGMEMNFSKAPIALSLDFRPGYGMMFRTEQKKNYTNTMLAHFFDWKIVAAVRYTF